MLQNLQKLGESSSVSGSFLMSTVGMGDVCSSVSGSSVAWTRRACLTTFPRYVEVYAQEPQRWILSPTAGAGDVVSRLSSSTTHEM